MDTTQPDWSSFTVKLPIDRPEEDIISAWITPRALESWFLKLAEFTSVTGKIRDKNEKIKPGDRYRWQWFGWPESTEENGEVIQPAKAEFLRFIFGRSGTVGIKITEEHGQRILSLVQEFIPTDEASRMNFHVGCKTGWTFYMLNLKSILNAGPDLRNKRSELQMD